MKAYFQKIYDETKQKPFTFLNASLCVLIPVIAFLAIGVSVSPEEGSTVAIIFIAALLICWGINFYLLYKKFNEKALKLMIFNVLASIAFWTKLILLPLFKIMWHAGRAAFHANMGNTTASVNSSSQMGASIASNKKSAFNWFEYEGKVWEDDTYEAELKPDYSLDEGAYSDVQNQAAKGIGYVNGKEAAMAGHKWNGSSWE